MRARALMSWSLTSTSTTTPHRPSAPSKPKADAASPLRATSPIRGSARRPCARRSTSSAASTFWSTMLPSRSTCKLSRTSPRSISTARSRPTSTAISTWRRRQSRICVRQRHRDDRLGHRHRREQEPARLFDDQGRHSRFCALARREPDRARHPRERGSAWAGMDAAQPGGSARGRRRRVRRAHPDEARSAARGDRAGFRVSRGSELLELHHGRDTADRRRLLRRVRYLRQRKPKRKRSGPSGAAGRSARKSGRVDQQPEPSVVLPLPLTLPWPLVEGVVCVVPPVGLLPVVVPPSPVVALPLPVVPTDPGPHGRLSVLLFRPLVLVPPFTP